MSEEGVKREKERQLQILKTHVTSELVEGDYSAEED